MKKTSILFCLVSFLYSFSGYTQETKQIRIRGINIRLSAHTITTPRYAEYSFSGWKSEKTHLGETKLVYYNELPNNKYWLFRAEGNYMINHFLDVGLWGNYGYIHGFKKLGERKPSELETFIFGGGAKANAYLLPLLFEKYRDRRPRVDLYLSAEFGGFYFRNNWQDDSNPKPNSPPKPNPKEVGGGHTTKAVSTIGGGVNLYIGERLGVYFDYQYGGFLTKKTVESSRALSVPKVGLTLRF